MNIRLLVLATLLIIIQSCKSKNEKIIEKENEKNISSDTIKKIVVQNEIAAAEEYRDTIKINYLENRDILKILLLLPESAMGSWKWSKEDRKETVDFIERNNYIIDSTKQYLNIGSVRPNYMGIQVVDGYWSLAIYEIENNNFIVITSDEVGDGSDISSFELNNEILKPVTFKNLLSEQVLALLINKNDNECKKLLEESENIFSYSFYKKDSIEISSPWYLKKIETQNCLLGNTLIYEFKKEDKRFELVEIKWTESKE